MTAWNERPRMAESNASHESHPCVTLELHSLKESIDWKHSSHTMDCQVQILPQGKIGDSGQVLVDFANKRIGFGAGKTQEEDLLGTFPEACLAALLAAPMKDDECVVIAGCTR